MIGIIIDMISTNQFCGLAEKPQGMYIYVYSHKVLTAKHPIHNSDMFIFRMPTLSKLAWMAITSALNLDDIFLMSLRKRQIGTLSCTFRHFLQRNGNTDWNTWNITSQKVKT